MLITIPNLNLCRRYTETHADSVGVDSTPWNVTSPTRTTASGNTFVLGSTAGNRTMPRASTNDDKVHSKSRYQVRIYVINYQHELTSFIQSPTICVD